MYSVTYTTGFKKALKRCLKRGLRLELFDKVVNELRISGTLPPHYKPHKLSSRFDNCWECHISPDWLLLWEQNDTELTLLLINTGSHSDIFG
ncbi:MAG: type II toxin-antitoxin system YafQ family toxin [Muribaculaceae bacterium]|nr:type II toxin-antitoxin system YafQ family toxin [Muribaculaceae bacterium]